MISFIQLILRFKRKAASLVNLNTLGVGYWSVAAHDVYADFITGGNFLRQKGKSQGGVMNAILGSGALSALMANSVFLAKQKRSNL